MNRLEVSVHNLDRRSVVEIHHPTMGVIGVIYPTETGVKIVSKYLDIAHDHVIFDACEAPLALDISIP